MPEIAFDTDNNVIVGWSPTTLLQQANQSYLDNFPIPNVVLAHITTPYNPTDYNYTVGVSGDVNSITFTKKLNLTATQMAARVTNIQLVGQYLINLLTTAQVHTLHTDTTFLNASLSYILGGNEFQNWLTNTFPLKPYFNSLPKAGATIQNDLLTILNNY